jgi:hypothetical protein
VSVLGRLYLPDKTIPPTTALTAIIGVHEGRDSMEAMVRALESEADADEKIEASTWRAAGWVAPAKRRVAEMIRRGTLVS